MARPEKLKRVCRKPGYTEFAPKGIKGKRRVISLSVDEYEAIRLIDLERASREECADRMGIARTTAQAIYNSAREKLAESIVNGLELHIEGGNISICDGDAECQRCCNSNHHGHGAGHSCKDHGCH